MTQIYIKQNINKHRTKIFRRVSPFGITPVEKAHKARTRWYRGPFRWFIDTRFLKSIKKGMDRKTSGKTNTINKKKHVDISNLEVVCVCVLYELDYSNCARLCCITDLASLHTLPKQQGGSSHFLDAVKQQDGQIVWGEWQQAMCLVYFYGTHQHEYSYFFSLSFTDSQVMS